MCYFRPSVTTSAGFVKYLEQHHVQNIVACAAVLYPDAACVCVCVELNKNVMWLYVSLYLNEIFHSRMCTYTVLKLNI